MHTADMPSILFGTRHSSGLREVAFVVILYSKDLSLRPVLVRLCGVEIDFLLAEHWVEEMGRRLKTMTESVMAVAVWDS